MPALSDLHDIGHQADIYEMVILAHMFAGCELCERALAQHLMTSQTGSR